MSFLYTLSVINVSLFINHFAFRALNFHMRVAMNSTA